MYFFISKLSFRNLKFFPLLSTGVRELGMYFRMFILQIDITSQNIAFEQLFVLHFWMSRSMVQHQAPDQSGVHCDFMFHMQDLDHVQVDGVFLLDAHNCVHYDVCEVVGQIWCQLGEQAGPHY